MGDDAVERAVGAPASEALVDGLPGAEALGHVPPLGTGLHDPEHTVEHEPVVFPLASGPFGTLEEVGDAYPLTVGEGVTTRRQRLGGREAAELTDSPDRA